LFISAQAARNTKGSKDMTLQRGVRIDVISRWAVIAASGSASTVPCNEFDANAPLRTERRRSRAKTRHLRVTND